MLQNSVFIFMAGSRKTLFQTKKILWVKSRGLKWKRQPKWDFWMTPFYQQNSQSISLLPPGGMLTELIPREHQCQKLALLPFYKCLTWKGNTNLFNFDNKHFSFIKFLFQHILIIFLFLRTIYIMNFLWFYKLFRAVSFFIILVKSLTQIESVVCIVAL